MWNRLWFVLTLAWAGLILAVTARDGEMQAAPAICRGIALFPFVAWLIVRLGYRYVRHGPRPSH